MIRRLLQFLAFALVLCACTEPEVGTAGAQLTVTSRQAFTTYGYSQSAASRAIVNGEAVGLWLGFADHDLGTDDAINVAWKQGGGIATIVDWSEVAIGTGQLELGGSTIAVAGGADVAPIAQAAGTVIVKVALARPVPQGSGLWLIFAAHSPGGGTPKPLGPQQAETVAAGLVVTLHDPGYRPSEQLLAPGAFFSVAGGPRGVSAAVVIP